MKYENKSFTVAVGGDAYADGWARTFGRREDTHEDDATEDDGPDEDDAVVGADR